MIGSGVACRHQPADWLDSLSPRTLGLQRGQTVSGTETRERRRLRGISTPSASAKAAATACEVADEPSATTSSFAGDFGLRPVRSVIDSATGSAGTRSAAAKADAPSDLPSKRFVADADSRVQRPDRAAKMLGLLDPPAIVGDALFHRFVRNADVAAIEAMGQPVEQGLELLLLAGEVAGIESEVGGPLDGNRSQIRLGASHQRSPDLESVNRGMPDDHLGDLARLGEPGPEFVDARTGIGRSPTLALRGSGRRRRRLSQLVSGLELRAQKSRRDAIRLVEVHGLAMLDNLRMRVALHVGRRPDRDALPQRALPDREDPRATGRLALGEPRVEGDGARCRHRRNVPRPGPPP